MRALSIATFATCILLAACSSTGAVEQQNEEATNNEIFTETSGELPDNWPEDAPIYPESTVQFGGMADQGNGTQGVVTILHSNDAVEVVTQYYQQELPSQGWNIQGTYQAQGSTIIAGIKGTRMLSVQISPGNEFTNIVLGVAEQ